MERNRDWQISLAAPVISALGMSENGTAITGVCRHSLDANRCLCCYLSSSLNSVSGIVQVLFLLRLNMVYAMT